MTTVWVSADYLRLYSCDTLPPEVETGVLMATIIDGLPATTSLDIFVTPELVSLYTGSMDSGYPSYTMFF